MARHRIHEASNVSDRKSRFLLIVDSDVSNLFYLSILLQRLNYQIYTARTAVEAIEMAAVAVPSLIITAEDLHDMAGLDLVQQLRRSPRTADVPFIVLVKQGDQFMERRSLEELGVAVSLTPPILPEVLYRTVQSAVETTPRTSIRVQTRLLVKVNNPPLNFISEGTSMSELSERGMFLRTMYPAPVNTRLSLQFGLNGQMIEVEAVVVYSTQIGGGLKREPGVGLEFTRIAPKDREFIRHFIRNEITRGIEPMNA